MTVKVKVLERPDYSLSERLLVFEILRGIATSQRHFIRNLLNRKRVATLRYPDEKRPYSKRWRGLHRLTYRDDGRVRCVACMMCSTNCPANCITIVAGESEDPKVEKYPVSFEIDLLKCIYCGYCEEACPCDAIRLDTGVHAPPAYDRESAITRKTDMLERGIASKAKQGGKSV